MVKEKTKNHKKYYIYEEGSFIYTDKKTAQQCEDYCKKPHSCSLDITKNAVNLK